MKVCDVYVGVINVCIYVSICWRNHFTQIIFKSLTVIYKQVLRLLNFLISLSETHWNTDILFAPGNGIVIDGLTYAWTVFIAYLFLILILIFQNEFVFLARKSTHVEIWRAAYSMISTSIYTVLKNKSKWHSRWNKSTLKTQNPIIIFYFND